MIRAGPILPKRAGRGIRMITAGSILLCGVVGCRSPWFCHQVLEILGEGEERMTGSSGEGEVWGPITPGTWSHPCAELPWDSVPSHSGVGSARQFPPLHMEIPKSST